MKFVLFLILIVSQIAFVNCSSSLSNKVFIRSNQIGFFPSDLKTAVILSKENLNGYNYSIVDVNSNETVYENNNFDSLLSYGNFNFCYIIDFSPLNSLGKYKICIKDIESYPFEIGNKLYNSIRDSLSQFFKVQRCGPTNAFLHSPCHLSDAYKLIGFNDTSAKDLTGGWHDAGDYIKFLKTTAYTTYLLLFAYELDKEKFGYDLNDNSVPDILEEAKIGIDWLLRCNINGEKLVVQVQDETDHNVGWRLPENDSLQFTRPAYVNIAKNLIGYYSATLSLASKIWIEKNYDNDFAKSCLLTAEKFYSLRNSVMDLDSTFLNFYPDKDFNGKLSLAAINLYEVTKNENYLNEAIDFAKKAGADYWWGIGNINSLAHFKIAKYEPDFSKYIYQTIKHCLDHSRKCTFNESFDYSWGTTNTFLGAALQIILFKKLTGSTEFDSLFINQRDYILGRNPWGKSFIYNIGSNSIRNLHSQIAFFNNGYLPGGLSAGPAPISILNDYKIKRQKMDLKDFNSNDVEYYDDAGDYICNEPTISSNATALFVFGFLSN